MRIGQIIRQLRAEVSSVEKRVFKFGEVADVISGKDNVKYPSIYVRCESHAQEEAEYKGRVSQRYKYNFEIIISVSNADRKGGPDDEIADIADEIRAALNGWIYQAPKAMLAEVGGSAAWTDDSKELYSIIFTTTLIHRSK